MTGRFHAIASKNEYTHDVMAGLSLRWAHMGFLFCLIKVFLHKVRILCIDFIDKQKIL